MPVMFNIVNFSPETPSHREEFERLNREWLEKYFVVEAVDKKYFIAPEKEILEKGGEIFFAEAEDHIVGTCSLILEDGKLELAKMGVEESSQGKGVGKFLVVEAIRRARLREADVLTLVTNSSLAPAIGLYKKLGFREIFRGQHPKYLRGDLVMELNLERTAP
jgi:ribosomal protein S18 acetylase RimI-like enzyme